MGSREQGGVFSNCIHSPLVGHEINLVGLNQPFFSMGSSGMDWVKKQISP